jgi:hypothetical protein
VTTEQDFGYLRAVIEAAPGHIPHHLAALSRIESDWRRLDAAASVWVAEVERLRAALEVAQAEAAMEYNKLQTEYRMIASALNAAKMGGAEANPDALKAALEGLVKATDPNRPVHIRQKEIYGAISRGRQALEEAS